MSDDNNARPMSDGGAGDRPTMREHPSFLVRQAAHMGRALRGASIPRVAFPMLVFVLHHFFTQALVILAVLGPSEVTFERIRTLTDPKAAPALACGILLWLVLRRLPVSKWVLPLIFGLLLVGAWRMYWLQLSDRAGAHFYAFVRRGSGWTGAVCCMVSVTLVCAIVDAALAWERGWIALAAAFAISWIVLLQFPDAAVGAGALLWGALAFVSILSVLIFVLLDLSDRLRWEFSSHGGDGV
jgi:hypothetical protein